MVMPETGNNLYLFIDVTKIQKRNENEKYQTYLNIFQSDDAEASFATPMRKHWLRRRKVYLPRGVLLAAIAFRFAKECGLPLQRKSSGFILKYEK